MNYLLDTHALIWALENNKTLSNEACEVILDGKNMIFVSAVSIWEITIKKSMGKLSVPDNLIKELEDHRFTRLNIEFEHAEYIGCLPDFHKDPFDRLLIAQAKLENLILITRDEAIAKYDVAIIRA